MRRSKGHKRPRRKLPLTSHVAQAGGSSPPLTTTLKTFVKHGSDRAFRELVYSFVALSNQMSRFRKLMAAHIGVSEAQAVILRLIAERQDASVGQLAQQLQVTSQFITIEVGNLVRNGIVEKRTNEADRRSVVLRLTAKGESLLAELSRIMRIGNDIYYRSLTKDRAKFLQEILNTILSDSVEAYHAMSAPNLRNRVV
jgi:DNA-binding MarR family transcriptional regulator